MKYSNTKKPIQCFMTQSTCYKGTSKMTVKGVLWHSTGANNPNLKRYVQPDDNAANRAELLALIGKNAYNNDFNHINRDAGLNCWIGKLADGSVATVQTMPWDFRPWGCGSGPKGSCNSGWIQFEICEDGLTDGAYFSKVYQEAVEITAYLCQMFGIDPNGTVTVNGVKVPTILCHADSHKLGLGSNHGDVDHWFPKHGKSMATARADVAALLKASSGSGTAPKEEKPATGGTIYRVQCGAFSKKANADALAAQLKAKGFDTYMVTVDNLYKVQTGAYSVKANADAQLKKVKAAGFDAFITTKAGTAVSSSSAAPAPAPAKSTTFAVGDKVKCNAGVTKFSNGVKMASWVPSSTLYVRAVESSGKILLVSTKSTGNEYTGRVNASDVHKI